jgi:HEAT repeat protein
MLAQELTTLSLIAKKDRGAYRLVSSALANDSAVVRRSAIQALPRMKHGSLAVPGLIALLKTDPENLTATVESLVLLADQSTEERIADAIASFRYHQSAAVRKAVDEALNNKLKARGAPR